MTTPSVSVREWTDVVRRARLGKTTKYVALMLATYADYRDGARIFPGVARLAVDCEVTYNVAQTAVAKLREVGLIERVAYGARRLGQADEYRLMLGPELLDHVEVLTPAQISVEVDRMQARHAGRKGPDPTDPDPVLHPTGRGAETDRAEVLHPTAQGAKEVDEPAFAPHGVGGKRRFAPHGDVVLHPTPLATNTHLHQDTTATPHSDEDLRTAVTHSRATGRDQDPNLDDGSRPPPPIPDRCPHNLRARARPDGSSSCALCRKAAPPTEPARRGNVIPIRKSA
ncbi:MAG TPA: hypothetical protein VL652_34910 [Kutzneria sp.]|nr:hypothetical protein [Kutzneria sp.]